MLYCAECGYGADHGPDDLSLTTEIDREDAEAFHASLWGGDHEPDWKDPDDPYNEY